MANDYTWTSKSDNKLTGYADKKTYKTLAAALKACASNAKCNGVTKEGTKKYRIHSGSTPSSKSGYTVYIKGGTKKATRTMYNTSKSQLIIISFSLF